jgi:hypothetical protein
MSLKGVAPSWADHQVHDAARRAQTMRTEVQDLIQQIGHTLENYKSSVKQTDEKPPQSRSSLKLSVCQNLEVKDLISKIHHTLSTYKQDAKKNSGSKGDDDGVDVFPAKALTRDNSLDVFEVDRHAKRTVLNSRAQENEDRIEYNTGCSYVITETWRQTETQRQTETERQTETWRQTETERPTDYATLTPGVVVVRKTSHSDKLHHLRELLDAFWMRLKPTVILPTFYVQYHYLGEFTEDWFTF